MHALIVAISSLKFESSKVPFYVAGLILASWAVVVAFIGIRNPDFPGESVLGRAAMALSIVLVLAAMTAAVATS